MRSSLTAARHHALAEVLRAEREPVAEELEHVVVARDVVVELTLGHGRKGYPQRVNWRLVIPVTFAVLVIWVVGAAVTKYSLEQMAYLAPIAVVVVGVQVGLIMLWVKIIRQSRRRD